jgi:Ca2+-binding RTX toxin-like protein
MLVISELRGAGDDVIAVTGGEYFDISGGSGLDTFVFGADRMPFGHVTIHDFKADHDRIIIDSEIVNVKGRMSGQMGIDPHGNIKINLDTYSSITLIDSDGSFSGWKGRFLKDIIAH